MQRRHGGAQQAALTHHQDQHRRHRIPDRDRSPLDELDELAGRVRRSLWNQVNRGTREESGVEIEDRQIEVERRMIRQPISVVEAELGRAPLDERQRVAVADAHALRRARAARRVQDIGQIARPRRLLDQRARIEAKNRVPADDRVRAQIRERARRSPIRRSRPA